MSLISKIKSLNFPPDQYVVIGSGILDALGIRPSVDIDIAVLPELHKRLEESGEWNKKIKYDKVFLEKDIVEVGPDLPWEDYSTTTKEAIASAEIIEGIPFMNLNELIKFKLALGREKDLKDIETIKKYLSKESSSFKLAKSFLGKEVEVTIDRPIGSKHPKYNFSYEVNYGYIKDVIAPDGEELDAYYLGVDYPLEKAKGKVIAIIHRTDNDDDKLVVAPEGVDLSDEEISKQVDFQEKWFKSSVVRN